MKTYKEMADEVLYRIKKEKIKRRKYLIVSLSIIFILPIFTFLLVNQNSYINDKFLENSVIITNYKTDLYQSYTPPKNGEYYCLIEVNEARKKYIDKNVSYLFLS